MARKRAPGTTDATDTLDESTEVCEERGSADANRLAPVSEKDVAKRRAQWEDSRMSDELSAAEASPLEGVDAGISAWAADRSNRSMLQGLSTEDEGGNTARVCGAKDRDLSAWSEFEIFSLVKGGAPSKVAADSCRLPTRGIAGGERGVEARFVAEGFQGRATLIVRFISALTRRRIHWPTRAGWRIERCAGVLL